MSNILELHSIYKTYNLGSVNAVPVLRGVNLCVKKSQVVALLGPSGTGKSTLLHIAGLLDTAEKGTVRINGQEQGQLRDNKITQTRCQDIGFVYQFHHLLPEFNALENLILPQMANGCKYNEAKKKALSLLYSAGLDKRADHRPAYLSGGEQQRVAFMRALVNDPKLLIADEPTGNLDPSTSDQVFDIMMNTVRRTGLSALIATHNLELANRMDRVITLQDGILYEKE